MTLGRHLDNDVLLAGEDVLDYHVRLELTDRGPRAIPLAEASLRVNGADQPAAAGLIPGDVLEVGRSTVAVSAERRHPSQADSWRLHRAGDAQGLALTGTCRVGRGEQNDLVLDDDHVSRHHAELLVQCESVWLRDLGSSNGTYVNGERLAGACRLFHGDEIRFDTVAVQLVGSGGELTPVRPLGGPVEPLKVKAGASGPQPRRTDTTEFAAVDAPPVTAPVLPATAETGAFLLGASEPVSGLTFRAPIGRTVIGRSDDCDLVIRDRTVSARHAELNVRPEGVTVTNLMATNGTRINGEEVQSARLIDGDILRFGRVSLVFKDVPAGEDGRPWLKHVQWALMGAAVILALAAAWAWLSL